MNPLVSAGASMVWHSVRRFISVICVALVCAGLYWAVYRTFIKPRPTESYSQIVEAGGTNYNIEVYNPEDSFFLGIKVFGLKLGISKPVVKKMAELAKEAEELKR